MFVALFSAVLPWVGTFVVPELDESVIARCQQGAEERAEPIDPVVVWEAPVNDAGSE